MTKTLFEKYATYEETNLGTATYTAYATGGQANATSLIKKYSAITTCATNFDSAKLMAAVVGLTHVVYHGGAKLCSVYPQAGEYINGTQNVEFVVMPGETITFTCLATGYWMASRSTIFRLTTTDATPVTVDVTYANAFSGNVKVIAKNSANTKSLGRNINVIGTLATQNATTATADDDTFTFALSYPASTTIRFTFTGKAATTIDWMYQYDFMKFV